METINEFLTGYDITYLDCSTLSPERIDAICKIITGDLTHAMQNGYTMAFAGLYLEKNKDIIHPVTTEEYYKRAFDVAKIPCIGLYYMQLKQYDLAISYLEKCNERICAKYIGICYDVQKKFANVIKYCKLALKYDENNNAMLNLLGHSYFKLNNYEDAEQCFSKTQTYNNGIFWLARVYQEQKRYRLAISSFAKFIDGAREDNSFRNSYAYSNIGLCYIELKEVELAEENYLKAIEHGNSFAYFNAGQLYESQQRYRLAKQYYEIAFNKDIYKPTTQQRLNNVNKLLKERAEKETVPPIIDIATEPVRRETPLDFAKIYNNIKSFICPDKPETHPKKWIATDYFM